MSVAGSSTASPHAAWSFTKHVSSEAEMVTLSKKFDAVYARYSSRKQEDGTSIEVQLETCHRAAGGPCVDYIDRARTGRTVAGRLQLLRLIEDAEQGKIGRLFVYKFDRLGRAAETHSIVADFEEAGVEVISATEGKEALSRGVQLVVAEHYSKALAERTLAGLLKRFEGGGWTGGQPAYGYRIIDQEGRRRLAIHPNEAEVIRFVIETYLSESVGVKELARRLRGRGVPTRKGADWSFTTVRGILVNEMLTGKITYNRRRMKLDRKTGNRLPRTKAEAEHLTMHDETLRIVADEEWAEIQRRLSLRSRPGQLARAARTIRPFTGHLYCAECGEVFYSAKSKNSKGLYRYYRCSRRQRLGPSSCPNATSIREDELLADVHVALRKFLGDTDSIIKEAVEIAKDRVVYEQRQLAQARQELRDYERKLVKLTDMLTDPDLDALAKRAISRQLSEAEAKREELQGRLVEVGGTNANRVSQFAEDVWTAVREVEGSITALANDAQYHSFVESFIGPISVHSDGRLAPVEAETATASDESEAVATSGIAGGRLEPLNMARAAFWLRAA